MTIIIPNIITAGNLFCGIFAILFAIKGNPLLSAYLIFVGMLFDFFDGKVARFTNTVSKFGGYLDSFADVISFGIAPMIITYVVCPEMYREEILLFFFLYAVCGVSRLIRYTFNLKIKKEETFLGLPIPAAAGIIVSLMLVYLHTNIAFPFTFVVGIIILCATLMVSTIPYQHFAKILDAFPPAGRALVVVLFLSALGFGYYYAILFLFFSLYAVFGIKWKKIVRLENPNA